MNEWNYVNELTNREKLWKQMDVGGGGECRNEIKRDKHAVHCDVKIVIFMKITGSKPISIPFDSIY